MAINMVRNDECMLIYIYAFMYKCICICIYICVYVCLLIVFVTLRNVWAYVSNFNCIMNQVHDFVDFKTVQMSKHKANIQIY